MFASIRSWLIISLCVAVFLSSFKGITADDPTQVVVLTDENFDEATAEGSWLIEFYAPWCGHCKKLAPIFDSASIALKGKLNLGKVDCTQETKVSSRFSVKSYPTLKFKRGDEMRAYSGPRSLEGLIAFGEKMNEAPVIQMTKQKQWKQYEAKTQQTPAVTFILFAKETGIERDTFTQVAYNYQGLVSFVHVFVDSRSGSGSDGLFPLLSSKFNIADSRVPCVLVLTRGGDFQLFRGPWEDEELRAFVEQHRYPLINELEGGNFEELTSTGELLVLIVGEPNTKAMQQYVQAMYPVAKYFRGKLTFASVDGLKFSKYVEQFSIRSSVDMPTVTILDYPDYFYNALDIHPSGPLPVSLASDFITQVIDGKLAATATIPWYHPARYMKMAERQLTKLSIPGLILVSLAGVVLIVAFVMCICKCLGTLDDDFTVQLDQNGNPIAPGSGTDVNGNGSGQIQEEEEPQASSKNIRKRDKGKPRRAD